MENKHHTLSRCTRTAFTDIDLKPNAVTRDQLNAIVNYPPTKQLSSEEQDLVWKFRHYLSSNKKVGKYICHVSYYFHEYLALVGSRQVFEVCQVGNSS